MIFRSYFRKKPEDNIRKDNILSQPPNQLKNKSFWIFGSKFVTGCPVWDYLGLLGCLSHLGLLGCLSYLGYLGVPMVGG
jgi:hypothetical protein